MRGGNGGSFNRGSLNNNPTNRDSADSKTPIYGCQCIGDQCAMWRWGTRFENAYNTAKVQSEKGYCGLANRPEVTA